jgi:CDP-paratose 2-epimerase
MKEDERRPILITGGCGFIGTNLAHHLLQAGQAVLLFDNLSRKGTEQNLNWLRRNHGSGFRVEIADVRDRSALRRAVQSARQVYHFAAQVAVTTSLMDPVEDFAINAEGTLNLLEELRLLEQPPGLVFTSTNKVYGPLDDVRLCSGGDRYEPFDLAARTRGIDETRPLDLHSPYGCSKGAADQYVIDYSRVYGIPTVVFRMSCIYGPHQFGSEDQGWVAHFLIRALSGEPITLYGDGLQVRDLLFIDDLVRALLLAQANMPMLSGKVFNMGGGAAHSISLLELIQCIEQLRGERPAVEFAERRVGDQAYYVTDFSRFRKATGWEPGVSVAQGLRRLYEWLVENPSTPVPLPVRENHEHCVDQPQLDV